MVSYLGPLLLLGAFYLHIEWNGIPQEKWIGS
jgi:hypothetical protein